MQHFQLRHNKQHSWRIWSASVAHRIYIIMLLVQLLLRETNKNGMFSTVWHGKTIYLNNCRFHVVNRKKTLGLLREITVTCVWKIIVFPAFSSQWRIRFSQSTHRDNLFRPTFAELNKKSLVSKITSNVYLIQKHMLLTFNKQF